MTAVDEPFLGLSIVERCVGYDGSRYHRRGRSVVGGRWSSIRGLTSPCGADLLTTMMRRSCCLVASWRCAVTWIRDVFEPGRAPATRFPRKKCGALTGQLSSPSPPISCLSPLRYQLCDAALTGHRPHLVNFLQQQTFSLFLRQTLIFGIRGILKAVAN